MLNWIKSLFTRLDRGDAAATRIAVALEDMAADVEAARDAMRTRLAVAEEPREAVAHVEDHAGNGKSRRKATV